MAEMPETMDEDSLYGASSEKPAENEADESVDQEEAEGMTAVVPNKLLSPHGEPLKEGDEIVVRVVKNYGEETEIEYAPHKPGDEEGEGDETTTPKADDYESELSAMDQKGY